MTAGHEQRLPPISAEPLYALLFNGVSVGVRAANLFLSLKSRQIITRWVYETLRDAAVEVRFLPAPGRPPEKTGVVRL